MVISSPVSGEEGMARISLIDSQRQELQHLARRGREARMVCPAPKACCGWTRETTPLPSHTGRE
jgi:hypothetical protein